MSDVILFTTPRPFEGLYKTIQINALTSWTLLGLPHWQLLAFVDPAYEGEEAHRFIADQGWVVKREVDRSPISGVPLVGDMFRRAQEFAGQDQILCYVNADIILEPDVLQALHAVSSSFPAERWTQWLAVARRWNVQVLDLLSFEGPWAQELHYKVDLQGSLMAECAIDLFAWKGDLFHDFGPFALGRYIWDNALLATALLRGAAVVDITRCARITHQSHRQVPWEDPDKIRNQGLVAAYCGLRDSTHTLTPEGLVKGWYP